MTEGELIENQNTTTEKEEAPPDHRKGEQDHYQFMASQQEEGVMSLYRRMTWCPETMASSSGDKVKGVLLVDPTLSYKTQMIPYMDQLN